MKEDAADVVENWREEKRSAYLYRLVAQAESGTPRQALFLGLANAAEKQAGLWAKKIHDNGASVPEQYAPDLRTRVVGLLVGILGPRRMRPALAAMKVRGMSLYIKAQYGHAMPVSVEEVGRRHRNMGSGGNLRAAVFGVNDGLVSNASLIMGVAGATSDAGVVLLSGVAGLVAGAFSMAAGEYVSVRSQREMYEYQIGLEREELDLYPEEEAAELALIYEARGLKKEEAEHLAKGIFTDPDKALDALAREELGLNPEELGSPWGAALFSFFSFAFGSAIPVLPYLFHAGASSLLTSIALSAVALFTVGATLSLFTGRHAWLGGLRMLTIGAAAGGATYFIGRLLGVTLT
ncbi:MAG TPA: VIT1/CCC1 transporter family protein [Burkholderiales bacterium]|nr:VIT1/CCC1 transporter family protein [Burkholderiales bacterium]